ncbi:efflux transporter outer membrane subunit [Aquabacterium soli]|uniref:Efflux transporter outer membrane subunit n=1 Tax=Aquabacterium soli TaxID=2493092 RepID=A0A3R8TA17_9BURK|nr:efflux transporter outer membrane subunit [Aquabacterium soli]RRS02925.1 efflux transporter outer membrane subunit [Aquabacterium soli]
MPTPRLACLSLSIALALAFTACATGPAYQSPTAQAPDDWTTWRSGDESLRIPVETRQALPSAWWRAFNDPLLDQLQQRAIEASPDLRTATLHFAQARVQRSTTAAQRGPDVGVSGGVSRQRQSEVGAGTRMLDALGGDRARLADFLSEPFTLYQAGFDASWELTRMLDALGGDRARLADFLSEPFTLYQAGFDASWELDLWGRVRGSIEAADADVQRQAALLDLARLSLASDVARHYIDLRTAQRQSQLAREDIAALQDRLGLLEARVKRGVMDHLDLERQRAELSAVEGQLPSLLAQESGSANQIALLLGERPGALRGLLAVPSADTAPATPPDLALGLPSELALRRPDIRAAEAQLHRATASIGVARADLYPSIRLGAKFGHESYLRGEFSDWGSRTWSIGPSLNLPLFDHGRRKSVVQLRELEQQEAAVNYQRTVLQAWQEIDDALNGYAAERQQAQQMQARLDSTRKAYDLARARYDGGTVDFTVVLDGQRAYLQARRDLVASQGRLGNRYVMVNRVIGNVPGPDANGAKP